MLEIMDIGRRASLRSVAVTFSDTTCKQFCSFALVYTFTAIQISSKFFNSSLDQLCQAYLQPFIFESYPIDGLVNPD